ncbi:hypothetical protein ADL19_14980 [Streptomyces purpurogeneiscleroticus]|nr:hypothetical protein ADL19_14980 [Streptomyces purpurogeneiscleroticus]
MTGIVLVVTTCVAIAGSQFRDHCDEQRISVPVAALPMTCVLKAQEEIAKRVDGLDQQDIRWNCERRHEPTTTGALR